MSKAVKLKNSLYLSSTSIVHKRGGGWYYLNNLLDNIYPVGSIFISTVNTNPSTYFGGTWERIKGRFLLAADDNTYKLGATGGKATHKHMSPLTWLNQGNSNWVGTTNKYGFTKVKDRDIYAASVVKTVYDVSIEKLVYNTSTENNMPPYIVVYIWKRVS